MNWLQTIADAVLGVIVGSLLADPLKGLWSATAQFIWEGRVREIRGHWDSTYSFTPESGKLVQHKDAIRLKQFGIYVFGKNEGRTNQSYEMKGRFLHQTLITGTWKSVRQEVMYFGTFQLVVSADGKQMSGKWLGNSNSGDIRCGSWAWYKRKQCETYFLLNRLDSKHDKEVIIDLHDKKSYPAIFFARSIAESLAAALVITGTARDRSRRSPCG